MIPRNQTPWSLEKDYETLINYPEVRDLVAKSARKSHKNSSAQEFLESVDFAFKLRTGFSLKTLSDVIVPIYQKIGMSTGKSAIKTVSLTVSEVIVKTLCSLVKSGYPLKATERASNGLILIARIPSDMWTWGGDLLITIEELNLKTRIAIDIKIKGQLYDWGKSKSVIKKMLSGLEELELNS